MLQSLVTFYEKKTWKLFLLRATKRVQKLNNSSQAAFRFKTKLKVSVVLLPLPHLAFTTTTTHYYLLGVLRPNPRSLSPSLSLSLHSSTGTKIITTRCSFADSCLYLWKKLTWGFKMWKHLSKWSVENEMRIWKAK